MQKYYLSVLITLMMSTTLMGLEGDALLDSIFQTQKKVAAEISSDHVLAWQTSLDSPQQITTILLTKNGMSFGFQCSKRSYGLSCQEDYFSDSATKIATQKKLDFINNGFDAALKKITALLKSKKLNHKSIQKISVWPEEEGFSGVSMHEKNVWAKFNFSTIKIASKVIVLCNLPATEIEFTCHYQKSAEGEPSFE